MCQGDISFRPILDELRTSTGDVQWIVGVGGAVVKGDGGEVHRFAAAIQSSTENVRRRNREKNGSRGRVSIRKKANSEDDCFLF